jgi:hypothetical protein
MATTSATLYDLETLFLEKLQEKYKLNIRDIKKAFSQFDLDRNGLLDLAELTKGIQRFLNGVKESQVRELVQRYDINGDGKISYEEFLQFLSSRSAIDMNEGDVEVIDEGNGYNDYEPDIGGYYDDDSRGHYPSASPQKRQHNVRPGTAPAPGHGRDNKNASGGARMRSLDDYEGASVLSGGTGYSGSGYGGYNRNEGIRAQRPMARAGGTMTREINQLVDDISDIRPPSSAASSDIQSVLNYTTSNATRDLESRAKVYITNLKSFLMKKANDMRLSGKINMPVTMKLPELHEKVARDILMKLFQPFTGASDGRVRRDREDGVEFPDFARVLRSFSFPGTSPIRNETIQYFFDLCSHTISGNIVMNEEGRPVADASHFIELIFGGKSDPYCIPFNYRPFVSPYHRDGTVFPKCSSQGIHENWSL